MLIHPVFGRQDPVFVVQSAEREIITNTSTAQYVGSTLLVTDNYCNLPNVNKHP